VSTATVPTGPPVPLAKEFDFARDPATSPRKGGKAAKESSKVSNPRHLTEISDKVMDSSVNFNGRRKHILNIPSTYQRSLQTQEDCSGIFLAVQLTIELTYQLRGGEIDYDDIVAEPFSRAIYREIYMNEFLRNDAAGSIGPFEDLTCVSPILFPGDMASEYPTYSPTGPRATYTPTPAEDNLGSQTPTLSPSLSVGTDMPTTVTPEPTTVTPGPTTVTPGPTATVTDEPTSFIDDTPTQSPTLGPSLSGTNEPTTFTAEPTLTEATEPTASPSLVSTFNLSTADPLFASSLFSNIF
jgi:hypothetical protein